MFISNTVVRVLNIETHPKILKVLILLACPQMEQLFFKAAVKYT